MALTLESCYSKKIGLPGYSSHQFMVTLRAEVNVTEDIPEAVNRMYAVLQESVDQEIRKTGWLPDGSAPMAGMASGTNGNGQPEEPDPGWACSLKQRKLIERVCREQGISDADLDGLAHARFGKVIHELNKLEASGLIDELLDAGARSGNGTRVAGNGRRYTPEPVGRTGR